MSKENKNVLTVVQETEILGNKIALYNNVESPLFLAKDVAEWIDYSKSNGKYKVSQMVKNVDEEDKGIYNIATLGGTQESTFLTEDGLYEVCMISRKPIAKQMKKEIKHYLKSIRLTSGYIPIAKEDDDTTIMAKALKIAEKTIAEKDAIIADMSDKVDGYEQLLSADGSMDMNTVAKELDIGEYKLFKYLRDKKVLFFNSDGQNVPYERFRRDKKFIVVEAMCNDGNFRSVTRVTKKGLDYIRKLIKKDNIITC